MSEGTRARGRLTPAPFAIPRDGGSIPPISTTWPLQVAVQGRAVVTVVSRWPASVVAVVLLVSISPRRRVRCAKKFALHGLIVGLCAKKFALRARNTPNLTFLRLLGEFCRGLSGGGAVPGEFCRVCRPATVPGTVPGPTLPRPRQRLAAPPPYFAVPRHPHIELRPETWTRLMVAVMRLPVGPDPGILPGSGP